MKLQELVEQVNQELQAVQISDPEEFSEAVGAVGEIRHGLIVLGPVVVFNSKDIDEMRDVLDHAEEEFNTVSVPANLVSVRYPAGFDDVDHVIDTAEEEGEDINVVFCETYFVTTKDRARSISAALRAAAADF